MGNLKTWRNAAVIPDSKALGAWVKMKREQAGMSQETLGDQVKRGKAFISKVEKATPHSPGGSPPSPTLDFLHKLARSFGVSIAEPLAALGYLKPGAAMTENSHPVRILRYYNELSPEDRLLAEEMVKALWTQRRIKPEPDAEKPKPKKTKVA